MCCSGPPTRPWQPAQDCEEADIITLKPVKRKNGPCSDPRAPAWQAADASTASGDGSDCAKISSTLDSKPSDSYDFFGRSLPRKIKHQDDGMRAMSANLTAPKAMAPVRPSFRVSPFMAEFQRQRRQSPTARILMVDEGGEFRAVLAAALLRHMLSRLRSPLDVTVTWASLGPASGRADDPLMHTLAASMGISLDTGKTPSRESLSSGDSASDSDSGGRVGAVPFSGGVDGRQFDDVADAVRYDLILAMDRFDLQELIKEVAVLDTINPGGQYANRVRLLGPFGMNARRAMPAEVPQDIPDPLYDALAGADDSSLQTAAKQLAFACRGLVSYLVALQSRCQGGVSLQEALAQSLRCPVLLGELPGERDRAGIKSPGVKGRSPGDTLFTVRVIRGQRRVVRRAVRERGFWKDPANIDAELRSVGASFQTKYNSKHRYTRRALIDIPLYLARADQVFYCLQLFRAWMRARRSDHLPTQRELRAAGYSSLASAIDSFGGLATFSARLGVGLSDRRPNGYWDDFDTLAGALVPYLRNASDLPGDVALLPTQHQLLEAGRGDLIRAIRSHGGSTAVAKRMGVGVRRGAGWTEKELAQQLVSVAGSAPSGLNRATLVKHGREDLATAVYRLGGFQHFQALMSGKKHMRQSVVSHTATPAMLDHGQWTRPTVPVLDQVAAQVQAWLVDHPLEEMGRMPTRAEMVASGRDDLWVALMRCGGAQRVSEYLGLTWVETRGRRRRVQQGEARGSAAGGGVAPDPREEIGILEAEEEIVFV